MVVDFGPLQAEARRIAVEQHVVREFEARYGSLAAGLMQIHQVLRDPSTTAEERALAIDDIRAAALTIIRRGMRPAAAWVNRPEVQ